MFKHSLIPVLLLLLRVPGDSVGFQPRPTTARPLMMGEWADIAILRDGSDYYLAQSSGDYYPGIPIWHSKNLRDWKLLTYAVWNPQPHNLWVTDLAKDASGFHLQYGIASTGGGHILSARSILGPWSDPKPTGLPPDGVLAESSSGERFLFSSGYRIVPLKPGSFEAAGPALDQPKWPVPEDLAIECLCPEAPKVLMKDGWWHLLMAAGGTFGPSTSHMVLSARAKHPEGPWELSPYNPVTRTFSRHEPWWSKGHAQLIDGPDGNWFLIEHGILKDFRSLGRATLIEPVEWTPDGWFRVKESWPKGWEGPARVDLPFSDEFEGDALGLQWQFHKRFDRSRFELGGGKLLLAGRGADAGSSEPLTIQARHRAYQIEADIRVEGTGRAGLMLFRRPGSYLGYSISADGVLRRELAGHQKYRRQYEPKIGTARVTLRIVNDWQDVRFYYRSEDGWKILQPGMEVSHGVSDPWNLRPALFATEGARAAVESFRYTPLETDEQFHRWLLKQAERQAP